MNSICKWLIWFKYDQDRSTGGIIWEVEGRGSSSKGVAYHTDSPTQVEDESSTWVGESVWYATPLLLLPDLPPPK